MLIRRDLAFQIGGHEGVGPGASAAFAGARRQSYRSGRRPPNSDVWGGSSTLSVTSTPSNSRRSCDTRSKVPFKGTQGRLQLLNGRKVEMVGWFVQDKEIDS